MKGVAHHLFGHVDGAVNYSVGAWLRDMEALLADLRAANRLPVIVGGTGLYFRALTQGLSEIPPVPASIRDAIRREAEGLPAESLHHWLSQRDPKMADRLNPTDPQRILRALEVMEATGQSLLVWQEKRKPPLLKVETTQAVFIDPPRPALMERINARFDRMMEQGALAEVEALRARGLDPLLPVMRAHGVPGLMAFLDSKMDYEAALEQGRRDTRHYAKRQVTWFRHQLDGFTALPLEEARSALLQAFR